MGVGPPLPCEGPAAQLRRSSGLIGQTIVLGGISSQRSNALGLQLRGIVKDAEAKAPATMCNVGAAASQALAP